LFLLLSACDAGDEPASPIAGGGNARVGRELIAEFQCGTCHTIPGIAAADGLVGPPLTAWSRRVYLAGRYPNEPGYLIDWLLDAPAHAPSTAMPDLDLTREQAHHIAAYLYALE
jgi:mono/diheme cytochrome c family protein